MGLKENLLWGIYVYGWVFILFGIFVDNCLMIYLVLNKVDFYWI